MTERRWQILFALSLATNLLLAGLLWLRPTSPAPAWDPLEGQDTSRLTSDEEISFLREYLTRSLTFDSSTFLSSQATTLPWLGPDLAADKKLEIQRLARKMRERSIEQEARAILIEQLAPEGAWRALVQVSLTEDGRNQDLAIENQMRTERAARTDENVWGLQVTSLESGFLAGLPELPLELGLARGKTTWLSFPCAIRAIGDAGSDGLRIRVVTTKSSMLSLFPSKEWVPRGPLTVSCEKLVFRFEVAESATPVRYRAIAAEAGAKAPPPGADRPQRNWIKRSLEKELGFEIDEGAR